MHITGVRHKQLQRLFDELPEIALDELEELLRLSRLVADDGGTAPPAVLADAPVAVGNTCLFMPSLGALAFCRAWESQQWFADDPVYRDLLLAYACHTARDAERLWQLRGPEAARQALDEWSRGLSCTLDELRHATRAAFAGFPETAASDRPHDPGALALVGDLMERFGGQLDYWLWLEPAQRVVWLGRELANARTPVGDNPAGRLHAAKQFADLARRLRCRQTEHHTGEE